MGTPAVSRRRLSTLSIEFLLLFAVPVSLSLSLSRHRKKKRRSRMMMQSLIAVLLLAVAGTQAARLTSTGVDLEPIFEFLDDDGDGVVNAAELKALTTTGDADGNGQVTATEFQGAWLDIAVSFGVPPEKHAKYFKLVDGVDGTEEDGVLVEAENVALFGKFDKDGSDGIDLDEFVETISGVIN